MKHIGRKLYHLFGGLGLLSLFFIFGGASAPFVYGGLFVIVLAADIARLRISAVNGFVMTRFGSFVRPSEAHKLTGTAPYILGVGLTMLLFRTDLAIVAVCFLAFGDVAATTIGERWGRTKIGEKSLEGTAAFIAAALAAGALLAFVGVQPGLMVIVPGALIAAGAELLPLPVNDNLVIPLVSGGFMELLVRMTM